MTVVDPASVPTGPTSPGSSARRWLDAHGLPSEQDESWRYTPVREIEARLAVSAPAVDGAISHEAVDALAGRHADVRVVLVNGRIDPDLSDLSDLPAGLTLSSRPPMTTEALPADPADGFDALSLAGASEIVHVDLAEGLTLGQPIHAVHVAVPTADRVLSNPRLVVEVGEHATCELIESYVGTPGAALTNASTSVMVGATAHVALTRVQDEAEDAVHIGRLAVTQRTGSHVDISALSNGGAAARLGVEVVLAGDQAASDLRGLSVPSPGRRHDTVVKVDHTASNCTSNQHFRAVVPARARSSFSGHVIVRPGTAATDAHQRSDSLLLSPDARADSRPWLEIFADDVRCDHGSTTGRLDDEALFYLRSRGIPHARAHAMLVEAFAKTITETIGPDTLRSRVEAWLRRGSDR